jgi:hypothetical protein
MSDSKPLALPPDLARVLGELGAATLVTTSPQPTTTRMTVSVSYIQRLRSFSAYKEGLGEIRASSMPELLGKLAAKWPHVQFTLILSKLARAEVSARRKGVPRAEG